MKPLNKMERTYVAANIYAGSIPNWYYNEWSGHIFKNGQAIMHDSGTNRHDELANMADRILQIPHE